ncbi:MAG: hypothetical protein DYG90_06190 [Chloroflexi bacterium CFX6]|nr:hypothetical protein [Chloroflexi bacterium CFX6]
MDLDNAVATWGRHVEAEIDKAIAGRQEKAAKAKGRGKGARARTLSREELEFVAERVWSRLVRQKLVWRFAASGGKSDDLAVGGYYVVEKDVTGTPADKSPWHGARRVIWDDGRVEEYDEDGRLIGG